MKASGRGGLARRAFLGALTSLPLLDLVVQRASSRSPIFVEKDESVVTIGNERIEVTIRREDGGIRQIRAVDRDLTLREPAADRPALTWSLKFYSDEYEDVGTASVRAGSPSIEVVEDEGRAAIRIEWTDASLHSEGTTVGQFRGTITVRAVVEAGEPFVRWHLDVQNNSDWAIRAASCPNINGIDEIDPGGRDELIIPRGIGRRFQNPIETLEYKVPHRYPSGFGPMQFAAYYGPSGGFYTHARDSEGYTKQLLWRRDPWREGPLQYRMRHLTPRKPGVDFSLPYPATVGILDGDWYDAAERYRAWLLSEGWLSVDDANLPGWLQQKGTVFEVLSYTRPDFPEDRPDISFDSVAKAMTEAANQLDIPLGLRWMGWEKYGVPSGLDWFPPNEGWEAFEDTLDTFEDNDIHLIGMHDHNHVLERSDFWQENHDRAEDWLVRDRDGSRVRFPANNYNLYRVEFSQVGWQKELRKRLRRLAEAGARESQLDGFPWRWVPECYAEPHGHPLGFGGNWFPQASKRALDGIKKEVRAERPEYVLSGEGICDYYLPKIDVGDFRDATAERRQEARLNRDGVDIVPLLPYILGDFHAIRTGIISPGLVPADDSQAQQNYHQLAVGRSLVWGAIPRAHAPLFLINNTADMDRPVWTYLARVAKARSTYANRFIARGRMLRAPTIDTDTVTIETEKENLGQPGTRVRATTPEVLTSSWQSRRGESGLLFTNVSPENGSQTVELDLTNQPTSLPEPPWLIYTVNNGDYDLIAGADDDNSTVIFELEKSHISLLVVTTANQRREQVLRTIIDAQEASEEDDSELIERAKRLFEADKLEKADSAIDAAHSTETQSTTDQGDTDVKTGESTRASTRLPDSTEVETPGFGILAGIAGIVSAIGYLLSRNGDNDE